VLHNSNADECSVERRAAKKYFVNSTNNGTNNYNACTK
jgi:hypothetical protein